MGRQSRHKMSVLIFDLFLLCFLTAIDQLTKYAAVLNLKDKAAIPLINGVLEFSYLENRGAAFSMLENQKTFFVIVAGIFLCVITYVLLRTPDDKKYRHLHILLTVIAAGALGNMIDRLRLDYVVDFIYISLINFPVFNVADMFVTFATAILVIRVLFVYEEDDFNFLALKSTQ